MAMFDRTRAPRPCGRAVAKALSTLLLLIMTAASTEAAKADALVQPPICSAIGAGTADKWLPFCHVTPKSDDPERHDLTLFLAATTGPVHVGGYRVSETENYNTGYLPPVAELMPGDTLKVRLLNALAPYPNSGMMMHGTGDEIQESTNVHTHGLIVSPKNARPVLPQNGDNIFIKLDRGQSLDYRIDIPDSLPASILGGKSGFIPHPSGLYWYHSHQHMFSVNQVSGGMSGLISIGAPGDNLLVLDSQALKPDPAATASLKKVTDVKYLILRDIQITSATDPTSANGESPAEWTRAPQFNSNLCDPVNGVVVPPEDDRKGYCQNPTDKKKIWLFTVNGQRFPTIRIPSGQNKLLRMANLSASVSYILELVDTSGTPVQFDLISVDGVVPGMPIVTPAGLAAAVSPRSESLKVTQLPLMPAARAEILLKNNPDIKDRRLVLRTRGVNSPADHWPKVSFAEVILEGAPVVAAKDVKIGLNVPNEISIPQEYFTSPENLTLNLQNLAKNAQDFVKSSQELKALQQAPGLPAGCQRDIDRTKLEHRRIWFQGFVSDSGSKWNVTSEIVRPKKGSKGPPYNYSDFEPDPDDPNASLPNVSFDAYLRNEDGSVDWDATHGAPLHTCVSLRNNNGHGQLWELQNPSGEMHNFHLHQTKFRLATDEDLKAYGIAPLTDAEKKSQRSELLLEPLAENRNVWHDTLPMNPNSKVPLFIVINFDAKEQLGRYVYHCHILAHEDAGLMAPIEVIP